ncbi:MAG: hypothetical protein WC444_00580 [Candidatus Paceibacterota bacterium]
MQFLIDTALTLLYLCAFLLLSAWTWRFWKMYVVQKKMHNLGADTIIAEIKLPRDIMKSPLAMETALTFLIQGGGVNTWYKRNFLGNLPIQFSLEIASLEGVIHFYVRMERRHFPLVQASLYGQYPGIEIVETDDYTRLIRYHHLSKDVDMWGSTYTLGKTWKPNDDKGQPYKKDGKDYEMPADYLSIKTYVDYGLDKDPKEEFKVDPITPLLEFMGSVGKGEYVWYQVIAQDEAAFNAKTTTEKGKKFLKTYLNEVTHEHWSLSDIANKRKEQIRKVRKIKEGDVAYDLQYGNPIQKTTVGPDGKTILDNLKYGEDREVKSREGELTIEEKDEIEVINHKLSKPLVRAVVRLIYVSKKEVFNSQNIAYFFSIMKPFSDPSPIRNGFNPNVIDPYDYPWQNFMDRRVPWRKEEKFEAYVEREGFFPHVVDEAITPAFSIQAMEDRFFWYSSMRTRKIFRLLYQAIFKPFYHPQPDEVIVLNLEEVATLWHFPGAVANTPTLPRIDSTKGMAPVNLPQ